jgi:hypothetical protein
VVESARLESVCGSNVTEGSNPSLSAEELIMVAQKKENPSWYVSVSALTLLNPLKRRGSFSHHREPVLIQIPNEEKTAWGILFRASYCGPLLPHEPWPVQNDDDIIAASVWTPHNLLSLIEHADEQLFRPELNVHHLLWWIATYAREIRAVLPPYLHQGLLAIQMSGLEYSSLDGWHYQHPHASFPIRS